MIPRVWRRMWTSVPYTCCKRTAHSFANRVAAKHIPIWRSITYVPFRQHQSKAPFAYGPLQASQAWHRTRFGAWPRYAPVYTIGAGHSAISIIDMTAPNLRHVVRVLIAFLRFRRCHRATVASLLRPRK